MEKRVVAVYSVLIAVITLLAIIVPSCGGGGVVPMATFVAHFMTPEGEPYPFDVTISNGTWRKEFNDVTYIETEVPIDATFTYVHDWDGHRLMNQFKLSLLPGERREFEIYSVNPAQSIERTRPYLLFQEVGANTSLSWNWDPATNNLTVSAVSEPNKIVDVGVFVDTNDREQPNYVLAKARGTENKWTWAVCVVILVDYQFCSNGTISLSFSEIEPDKGIIGFRKALFNGAIIDTFTTRFNSILRGVDGTLYDMEYDYPQYAVSPGSYILQPQGLPEEYAELKLPLNLQISKPAILDLYPPKIADIEPFTFSVAAEYFFAHSSCSSLTHDEDTDTLIVNVSTQTDYDWWGCFVLPGTATVAALHSYDGAAWHNLTELYDYTINLVDGYNICAVRITPEIERLALNYTAPAL
jgi:hypothetical protein